MHHRHHALFVTALIVTAAASTFCQTYRNPVIDRDAPDPSVLRDGSNYYVYVTGYNCYSSTDLVSWGNRTSFYRNADWAPDVYKHTDGKYYLYYTQSGGGGIGIAVSTSPISGFSSVRSNMGGIDAHFFADTDGQFYLYRNGVMAMRMSDPQTPNGSWTTLTSCSQQWEREGSSSYCPNEGPWMVKHQNTYYLMYSGSGWAGPTYAVGYATAGSPTGPFTKFWGNPIMQQSDYDSVYGPGHHSVTTDDNGVHWAVYHQRSTNAYGSGPIRFVCIDPLWVDSSGIMHIRVTRGKNRPAPGSVVWPARPAFTPIEIESHDGCHNKLRFRAIGSRHIGGNTQDSTYVTFRTVHFGATAATGASFNLSSSSADIGSPTGTISIRLGGVLGRVVGTLEVTATGTAWQTQSCALGEALSGTHDIVLSFATTAEAATVANIDWFQFTSGETATVPARATAVTNPKAGNTIAEYDILGRPMRNNVPLSSGVRLNGTTRVVRIK